MKKEMLIALFAIGFVFAGVISASAGTVTWTLVQTAGMAQKTPGNDDLLGTSDDGTGAKCNYSDATACAVLGTPTEGAYSFSKLNFVQASGCALAIQTGHEPGDDCTTNADCGGLGVCADCNTASGGLAYSYFAKNPTGGSKGLGTLTQSACDNGFTYTNIAIGTSEVIAGSGGGCITLTAGSGGGTTGCSVGPVSNNLSMDLYTSTIPTCGFKAGVMPGIALAGRVFDAGAAVTNTACGYTTGQIGAIIGAAGLGSGQYLSIMCGSGTLPTTLKSACLPGADWLSVMVAKTSANVPTSCSDACSSGGCMAGTAEGVE